jgi:hypothetical protein
MITLQMGDSRELLAGGDVLSCEEANMREVTIAMILKPDQRSTV